MTRKRLNERDGMVQIPGLIAASTLLSAGRIVQVRLLQPGDPIPDGRRCAIVGEYDAEGVLGIVDRQRAEYGVLHDVDRFVAARYYHVYARDVVSLQAIPRAPYGGNGSSYPTHAVGKVEYYVTALDSSI